MKKTHNNKKTPTEQTNQSTKKPAAFGTSSFSSIENQYQYYSV